jgi:hypothetical protein
VSAIDQSTSSKFLTEERQRAEEVPHKFAIWRANLWGPRRGQKGQVSNLPVLVKFNTFFILCLLPERFEAPEFIRGEDNQIWSEMRSTRYNTSLLETPKFIYGVSFSIAAYLRKPLCVYVLLPSHD